MRSRCAAVTHRGVLLLAATWPAFLPICSLHAQVDAANVTSSSSPTDTVSQDSASPAENEPSPDSSQTEATSSEPVGTGGLTFPHGVPPAAFGEQPFGIPYSKVLVGPNSSTGAFNALDRNPFPTSVCDPAKLGSVEGSLDVGSLDTSTFIPFLRPATEPENADIKAGPFFIKFHYLNGIVLYDDNYNRTENNRQSELLVLLNLNLTIIAQISEGVQFAASGSISYLPIQNQFGIIPSPFSDLGLFLYAAPYFASQLAYQTNIGGWPVVFADTFRAAGGIYSDNVGNDFDLFQGDTLQRDQDGTYTFHSSPTLRGGEKSQNSNIDSTVGYFSNTISAVTDQMLPGELHFIGTVRHEDLWYNQDNRGLPPSRDDLYASIISERENLRFKPYATYQLSYIENDPGVTQSIRGGIFGPIDDQLFLNANAGVGIDAYGHNSALYHLSLTHDAGPYTTEQVSVDSYLSTFYQEHITSEYYRLYQILGPTLSTSLFLDHLTYDDLTGDGTVNHSDDLAGLQFNWEVGPKTNLVLSGIYAEQRYTDGERRDTTTGRVILNRILTDDLTFQLLYEYQHSAANRHNDTYLENIVYFSIVKYLQ